MQTALEVSDNRRWWNDFFTTQQCVNLLAPGALYGERINVVDMRFAKVLRFGRTGLNVGT